VRHQKILKNDRYATGLKEVVKYSYFWAEVATKD
jgi:hypothetical protein